MGKLRSWPLVALLLAAMLVFSSVATVARGQDAEEAEDDDVEVMQEAPAGASESSDVVHVEDEGGPTDEAVQEDRILGAAPGVETVHVFPNNPKKVIAAGQPTELVVGLRNSGESPLKVVGIRGAIVYPIDFRVVVQNLTVQEFNTIVQPGVQASFFYTFTPMKQLLPREFGFSSFVLYEVDSAPFMSVAYNGTVEITEPRGAISGEFIFLLLLGTALLGLLLTWAYTQLQNLSKKNRRTKKVETGTTSSGDVATNEWLQGTALTQKAPKSVAQPVRSRTKK